MPLLAFLLALTVSARAEDPAALLVIGDSHATQIFGKTLEADLRSASGKVALFAVCSSRPDSFLHETEHSCGYRFRDFDQKSPSKWERTREGEITVTVDGKKEKRKVTFVKTPKLETLLADYSPAGVIVALGSNGMSGASIKSTLEKIHHARSDRNTACFWIGPPRMRSMADATLAGYYKALKDNDVSADSGPLGGGCRLILDSRSLDWLLYPEKGGDGTHYDYSPELHALGERWGHAAAKAFASALNP